MIRLKAALLALLFFFGCAGCGFYAGPHGVGGNFGDASLKVTDKDDREVVALESGPLSEGSAKNVGTILAGVIAYFLRAPVAQAAAPQAGHTHSYEHDHDTPDEGAAAP